MHQIVQNLVKIQEEINSNLSNQKNHKIPKIIAVSKTFGMDKILPLVEYGHLDFGENKVQEAVSKWTSLKKVNENIKLHMVGRLQSNKAKDAIKLFDYIHSLDSQKLADVLSKHQLSLDKQLKYFIQVNIGNEIQKSGVPVNEIDSFYNYCVKSAKLDVIGLMIIPPNNKNTKLYFKSINELNQSLALKELSMGMSADYTDAIQHGATFVRIGSSIFGSRSQQ